jgi:hypothetical protein
MVVAVMALAIMVMFSAPAFADSKNKGAWFVYGLVDSTAFDTGHEVDATKTLFGIGVERTFDSRFLKRLWVEYAIGSAEVNDIITDTDAMGAITTTPITTRYGGRSKFSIGTEVSFGRGWTLIPSYSTSNAWAHGQRLENLIVRFGKRF